ncbi:MAG TPA: hypothetical protein VGG06_29965 [Thermoanaerobaculia bacterium]|jgi:hypothetical protein
MTPLAIGTMIVICGFVWGGLAALAAFAVASEGKKRRGGAGAP